ncbi:MAG: Sir2 family NAD-dependent protein deacetylase [Desulfuromonadaceae bacterium]|nr:Sir2 family NAD-dependent protein deacetylase [Desulfuromonadaceae bacterium]
MPERITTIKAAAEKLRRAKALIIATGAGMGVDSGLPDFRGDKGFWNAYPMYERLGLNFYDAANPIHFQRDPEFGWGFYGHRTNLYRETAPHLGFHILRQWGKELNLPTFVVTSNVDGQFQKAGFDPTQIFEVHGSIHHLQCLRPCSQNIWDNHAEYNVDPETMRCSPVPTCPHCSETARPNILMFGDFSWIDARTSMQEQHFRAFLGEYADSDLLVLELGAGTAVPTIRHLSNRLGSTYGASIVRINPREAQIQAPHLSIALGALEGLEQIKQQM